MEPMNENNQAEEMEINLSRLFSFYLRNWISIVCCVVVFALGAFVVTKFFVTPQYRASVTVYVNNSKNNASVDSVSGGNLNAAQQLVNTYVNIIKSDTVIDEVIAQGALQTSADGVRSMMTASQVDNTEMFRVTISHPNPQMAAHIANTIALVAPDRISTIVKGSSTEIIDFAKVPTAPYTPSYSKNVVMGGLLGGILLVGILTLRFLYDMRIKTEEDVAVYLKVPVLGLIPDHDATDKKKSGRYETSSAKGGR